MSLLGSLSGGGGGVEEANWGLLIFYAVFAIGVSFFCSIWEAVLLSVTRPYIANLKAKGRKSGQILEELKNRINRPLTSILTLNTIAHTLGAMGVGSQVPGGWMQKVAGAVMTLAVLVLSEIIPKNLGARYWRGWAPWVGRSLRVLNIALFPATWVVEKFSQGGHSEDTFSRDELAVMADLGRRQGKLREDESRILTNLLRLRYSTVRDVMTPRVVVFALPAETRVQDFMDQHATTPFSRIPIYRETKDEIDGFVLKDEVLLAAARNQYERPFTDFRREIPKLPFTAKIADAFERLIEERHHIALVLDEFGGLEGLVTMEDIVETLLGLQIVDEADNREDMQAWARTLWKQRAARMGVNPNPEKDTRSNDSDASPEDSAT